MHLNTFTDYALRVLIYTAAREPERVSLSELAEAYGISRNHLVRVVSKLARIGYLETARGRGGGIRIGRPAGEITLGEVVRATEPGFDLAECFRKGENRCRLTPVCQLKGILGEATGAFLDKLDSYTLLDIVRDREAVLDALATPATA